MKSNRPIKSKLYSLFLQSSLLPVEFLLGQERFCWHTGDRVGYRWLSARRHPGSLNIRWDWRIDWWWYVEGRGRLLSWRKRHGILRRNNTRWLRHGMWWRWKERRGHEHWSPWTWHGRKVLHQGRLCSGWSIIRSSPSTCGSVKNKKLGLRVLFCHRTKTSDNMFRHLLVPVRATRGWSWSRSTRPGLS